MKINTAEFKLGAASWASLPSGEQNEIAFVGRSNVGKSSLINMVVGRKALARTSNTPGKTQQFNYYLINEKFYFVDLPGFGYARVSKQQRNQWKQLIGKYLTERSHLRLVFHLIDSRHAPMDLDKDVMLFMKGSGIPYVVILTKADKLSGNERGKSVKQLNEALLSLGMEVPAVLSSSKTARGKGEIMKWVEMFGLTRH